MLVGVGAIDGRSQQHPAKRIEGLLSVRSRTTPRDQLQVPRTKSQETRLTDKLAHAPSHAQLREISKRGLMTGTTRAKQVAARAGGGKDGKFWVPKKGVSDGNPRKGHLKKLGRWKSSKLFNEAVMRLSSQERDLDTSRTTGTQLKRISGGKTTSKKDERL